MNHKQRIVAEVMEYNPDGLDIGVPDDYTPSDGEVDNIVYLTCRYTAGWHMRSVDLVICKQMAGDVKGADGIARLVKTACEYVWDHVCGEPNTTSPEKFFEHMKPMFEEWYSKTTPDERGMTQ